MSVIVEIMQLKESTSIKVIDMVLLYSNGRLVSAPTAHSVRETYRPYVAWPMAHLDQLPMASDAHLHVLQPAPE
jgi:hypothetical protein